MTFALEEPESLETALAVLARCGEHARVIAGGQSLMLMMRAGLVRPRVVVALGALKELAGVKILPDGTVRIGALTTHRQLLESVALAKPAGALLQAVSCVGSTPVRNFGTLGGNICHNEMGSDPPTALLLFDAVAECRSTRGMRKVPLRDFLTGYFETDLSADEIVAAIEIPPLRRPAKGIYLKHALRPGDLAIVGVAASLEIEQGSCVQARLALGGVAPVSFRATEAERLLTGTELNAEVIEAAGAAAAALADPVSDAHASAEYRKKMIRVYVRRALKQIIATRENTHEANRAING
jgi:aerobic carbon-monoxide dehydrogenase medium subunit